MEETIPSPGMITGNKAPCWHSRAPVFLSASLFPLTCLARRGPLGMIRVVADGLDRAQSASTARQSSTVSFECGVSGVMEPSTSVFTGPVSASGGGSAPASESGVT